MAAAGAAGAVEGTPGAPGSATARSEYGTPLAEGPSLAWGDPGPQPPGLLLASAGTAAPASAARASPSPEPLRPPGPPELPQPQPQPPQAQLQQPQQPQRPGPAGAAAEFPAAQALGVGRPGGPDLGGELARAQETIRRLLQELHKAESQLHAAGRAKAAAAGAEDGAGPSAGGSVTPVSTLSFTADLTGPAGGGGGGATETGSSARAGPQRPPATPGGGGRGGRRGSLNPSQKDSPTSSLRSFRKEIDGQQSIRAENRKLREQCGRQKQELQGATGRVAELEKLNRALLKQVHRHEATFTEDRYTLQTRAEVQAVEIEALEGRLRETDGKVKKVRDANHALQAKLKVLGGRLRARDDLLEQQNGALKAAVEARLALEGQAGAAVKGVAKAQRKVAHAGARGAADRAALGQAAAEVADLGNLVGVLHALLAAEREGRRGLEAQLGAARAALGRAEDKAALLAAVKGTNETKLLEFAQVVGEMTKQLANYKEFKAKAQESIQDLSEDLSHTAHSLSSVSAQARSLAAHDEAQKQETGELLLENVQLREEQAQLRQALERQVQAAQALQLDYEEELLRAERAHAEALAALGAAKDAELAALRGQAGDMLALERRKQRERQQRMQDEVEAEMEQVRGSLHRETRRTQELQDAVNRLQRENAQHQIHRAAPAKKKALEDRAVDANVPPAPGPAAPKGGPRRGSGTLLPPAPHGGPHAAANGGGRPPSPEAGPARRRTKSPRALAKARAAQKGKAKKKNIEHLKKRSRHLKQRLAQAEDHLREASAEFAATPGRAVEGDVYFSANGAVR